MAIQPLSNIGTNQLEGSRDRARVGGSGFTVFRLEQPAHSLRPPGLTSVSRSGRTRNRADPSDGHPLPGRANHASGRNHGFHHARTLRAIRIPGLGAPRLVSVPSGKGPVDIVGIFQDSSRPEEPGQDLQVHPSSEHSR
jgi:hypothetical protein